MPIKILYTENRDGVTLQYSGITTGKDFIQTYRKVLFEDSFKNLKYIISDRTENVEYQINKNHILSLAQMTEEVQHLNPSLLFAVISVGELEFGMARMYQLITDKYGFKIHHCKNMSEAMNWVNDER